MRNSKKFLTLVLAVLMVMSTVAFSTSAASFTDVKIDTKALYQATGLLSDLGVTKGTTETTFSPGDNVTREQMAAFVYRLMKAGKSVEGGTNSSTFTDLVDPTFFFMVSWANNQGIIKGRSETSFDPKGGITLQDAYTMLIRALGYEKKESVSYPYGYIDIAEDKGLDENLPSTLKYTDTLTRGDVAIILYNTFFADMAEGDTVYKTVDGVVIPETVYPTVAEKIFGVKKDTQRVVATPNFYLDDATIDSNNFDTDVLLFKGNAGYRTFEELGLSGKADDYFLSDFTLYLKDETKTDGTVETKVLYAEPLLTKKTVSKATVGKVTPLKNTDYYNDASKSYAKASGLLTIDGVKAYLYNAPYSYTKPQITNEIAADPIANYAALNKKDVEFIGLAPEAEEGISHFVTSTFDTTYNTDTEKYETDIFGLPAKSFYGTDAAGNDVSSYKADVFTKDLNQLYNDGYYELDTYDSDSDGVIDYIWYKPYTFGQAIKDEDYATLDTHVDAAANSAVLSEKDIPTIYTFDATLAGASFKDKDFVIAYVNGPANYIKVASIVDKTSSEIKSVNSASYNVVLKNGSTVNAYGTNKMLVNFTGSADSEGSLTVPYQAFTPEVAYKDLFKSTSFGIEKDFYVYGGRLLYTEVVPAVEFNAGDPILIPQEDKTRWGNAMENNYLVQRPAITAYVSGSGSKSVIIPVEVEGNDPVTNYVAADDAYNFIDYKNQICTFVADSATGIYTIVKAITENNTGDVAEAAIATDDETAQYALADVDDITLNKVTGATYTFSNPSVLPNGSTYFTIQEYTKIIIRSKSEETGSYIFTEYGLNKLPNFSNTLNNVQFILSNNTASTRTEYLAALYGETEEIIDVNNESSDYNDNYRIIKTNLTIDSDADGLYHYYYDVINPFTGKVETNVPGSRASSKASTLTNYSKATIGQFYEVIGGVVQDKVDSQYDGDFVFDGEGKLSRSETAPTPANLDQILSSANGVVEFASHTDYIYKTDSDTKVIMIEAGGDGKDDFKWSTVSAKTIDDLGSDSIALRNYCVTTNTDTQRITTTYADNLEVFFKTDDSKTANDSALKVLDYVIIIRQKVSDSKFLNDNDKLPA